MSLRQQLIDAVKTRFALITIAGGYQTNIGSKLREWHVTSLDTDQLDTLIIRDTIDAVLPDDPNSGKRTWNLTIIADAIFTAADDNPAKARKAIADIKKAILVDQRWGGLARRTDEVSDQLMIEKEGTRVGGAQVIFKIVTSRKPFEA